LPPTPWVAWGGAAGGAGLTFVLLRAARAAGRRGICEVKETSQLLVFCVNRGQLREGGGGREVPCERSRGEELNSGVFFFGSPPYAEDCFRDARTSEWPVWAQNGKKTAQMELILCVSSKLFYSSGIQRLKCIISKQTSSKQHVLALDLCD
jgi:hypothetical protein